MTFRHIRLKSPSIPRERTRDELIDSIVHTRTREHRAMPGEDVDVDGDLDVDGNVDDDGQFDGDVF